MMISTKGRYALRVLLDMAMHQGDSYVSLTDIAERQQISVKYLEAIAAALSHHGVVASKRGKNGGYRLSCAPEDCTVGAVIKAAEGGLSPVACPACDGDVCAPGCLTYPLWRTLDGMIDEYLEKVTLADLLHGTLPSPESAAHL